MLNWNSPRKALLSLAGLVESHMGGTSGAVRKKRLFCYQQSILHNVSLCSRFMLCSLLPVLGSRCRGKGWHLGLLQWILVYRPS